MRTIVNHSIKFGEIDFLHLHLKIKSFKKAYQMLKNCETVKTIYLNCNADLFLISY